VPLDLDALTAIEVHVHVESDGHGHHSLDDEMLRLRVRGWVPARRMVAVQERRTARSTASWMV
jgi:hypothetical protein